MAEQTRLEQEAIIIRKERLIKNDFQPKVDGKQYDYEHDSAKTHDDELHPLGKGTGSGGHTHVTPNRNAPKTINYTQFNTEIGGGSYDIYGANNVGGRRYSQNINLYGPDRQYNENSIDMSQSEIENITWEK